MDDKYPDSNDETYCDERHDDSQIGLVSSRKKTMIKYPFTNFVIIVVQSFVILFLGASLAILAWRSPNSLFAVSCQLPACLDVGIICKSLLSTFISTYLR